MRKWAGLSQCTKPRFQALLDGLLSMESENLICKDCPVEHSGQRSEVAARDPHEGLGLPEIRLLSARHATLFPLVAHVQPRGWGNPSKSQIRAD